MLKIYLRRAIINFLVLYASYEEFRCFHLILQSHVVTVTYVEEADNDDAEDADVPKNKSKQQLYDNPDLS